MATTDTSARRTALLDAITGVFMRFGFRKTSMDDLARAAGLSRQGLYLQFPTKEALFKAAVLHVIDTSRAAALAALSQDDVAIEDRLLQAFEALHGVAIGPTESTHLRELLETATRLIGPAFEDLEQGFVADVARVLRQAGVADRWKPAGLTARDLADHLYFLSTGVKHRVSARTEYRTRMRNAIRMVCRG